MKRSEALAPRASTARAPGHRPRASHLRWLLAVGALALSVPAGATGPLTLERALTLAQQHGPSLIVAIAQVERAEAEARGAALLLSSNPTLEAALGTRLRGSQVQPELSLQLTQPLELFGTAGARRREAAGALQEARAQLEVRRVELSAEVREAFGRALAADLELALATESVALAREAAEASQERMKAGAASRIEVNTARGLMGRALQEQAHAQRQKSVALGRLGSLVGLSPDATLVVTGTLGSAPAERPALEAQVARASAHRADLLAARAEVAAARAGQTLAEREAWPSPTVGVAYGREEDANIVQGLLSVPLPVSQRDQGARGAAAARLRQAEATAVALERAIRAEVRLAAERLVAARAAVEAYEGGVVEALDENVRLVTEAYRAGKMDLFQLLVIRRDTLDARRSAIVALEELNAAEAALDRAQGARAPTARGGPLTED